MLLLGVGGGGGDGLYLFIVVIHFISTAVLTKGLWNQSQRDDLLWGRQVLRMQSNTNTTGTAAYKSTIKQHLSDTVPTKVLKRKFCFTLTWSEAAKVRREHLNMPST